MLLTYVNNKGGEAMPRPCRKRKVCRLPRYAYFGPNPSATKTVVLSIDEYETIRLMDLEGLTQQECAKPFRVFMNKHVISLLKALSGAIL